MRKFRDTFPAPGMPAPPLRCSRGSPAPPLYPSGRASGRERVPPLVALVPRLGEPSTHTLGVATRMTRRSRLPPREPRTGGRPARQPPVHAALAESVLSAGGPEACRPCPDSWPRGQPLTKSKREDYATDNARAQHSRHDFWHRGGGVRGGCVHDNRQCPTVEFLS